MQGTVAICKVAKYCIYFTGAKWEKEVHILAITENMDMYRLEGDGKWKEVRFFPSKVTKVGYDGDLLGLMEFMVAKGNPAWARLLSTSL